MKKIFILLSTTLLILGIIFFVPAKKALILTNRKNPSEKVISVDGYKNGFIISYTHSVNKGRVHDFYKSVENKDPNKGPKNQLKLYQTEFVSYGAGIPEPYETVGSVFEVTDDGYFIKNLNRQLPKFIMAVGVIADHSIIIGNKVDSDKEIMLTDYFLPQTSLIFEIKRVSLFDLISNSKI